ncbi:MAG: DUF1269 domain-containing protein [Pseudonocardia sp.]|nr:DUF1269 domain-containing protein [Pseudonocardia sp.]
MNTVSTWRFAAPDGAAVALRALERSQTRRLVIIDDAAVVAWRPRARRPHCYQVGTAEGTAALSGAFWGLLFGLLFLLPLTGTPQNAAVLARVGLSDEFLQQLRDRITAGTSALFLLTRSAEVDRIREALADTHVEPLVSILDHEQAAALLRAFTADDDLDDLVNR